MSSLGEQTYALIAGNSRSIGGLIPHATVEEIHRDGMVVTQHPVEKGAVISDHAFMRPCEVEVRAAWSNALAGDDGYARTLYAQLRKMQQSRQLLGIYTGKRAYTDMLMIDLGVHTDAESEFTLVVSARFQQLILTSTQTTGTGSSTTGAGGTGDQANPQSTDSPTNAGTKEAAPVGNQDFAGSFNPGTYSPDGGSVGNGSFGLGGVTTGGAQPDGVSPSSPGGGYFPGSEGDAGYDPYGAASPTNPAGDYSGYSAPEPANQTPGASSTPLPSGTTTDGGGNTVPSTAPYNPFVM